MRQANVSEHKVNSSRHWVSLAKAVSWRTAGSLSTVVIVYVVSGRLDMAAAVGGAEVVAKIGLFYVHEILWERFLAARGQRTRSVSAPQEIR